MNNNNFIDDVDVNIRSFDLTHTFRHSKSIKFHNKYAIWYLLEGSIKVKLDNNEYIAEKNDVFLIYPFKIFTCKSISKTFLLRSIHFDVFFKKSDNMLKLINMVGLYPSNLFQKESKIFRQVFDKDQDIKSLTKIIVKGYIIIILGKIFLYFNEKLRNKRGMPEFLTDNFNNLQIIFEYIYNNINKKLTLDELAPLVNLSPNYFCTYFKNSLKNSHKKMTQRFAQ